MASCLRVGRALACLRTIPYFSAEELPPWRTPLVFLTAQELQRSDTTPQVAGSCVDEPEVVTTAVTLAAKNRPFDCIATNSKNVVYKYSNGQFGVGS